MRIVHPVEFYVQGILHSGCSGLTQVLPAPYDGKCGDRLDAIQKNFFKKVGRGTCYPVRSVLASWLPSYKLRTYGAA